MANYSHIFSTPVHFLPVKVQAQTIKNNGKYPIYVCDIEDDLPLTPSCMLAYSKAVILPGQELDLTCNPYILPSVSNPDYDVTVHSDNPVDIEVCSYDRCDRWSSDPYHPWGGHSLPNGTYTEKFKNSINTTLSSYTSSGWWGNFSSPLEDIVINNIIQNEVKKCTCGIASLKSGGRHSNWCDLEGK